MFVEEEKVKINYFVPIIYLRNWAKSLIYPVHDRVAQGNVIYNQSHEGLLFFGRSSS